MTGLAELIQSWGYPAVFLGAALEGETVVALSGFAAHRGYLDLGWVMVLAAIGAFVGDQAVFWIGRWRGPAILAQFPRLAAAVARSRGWVERFPTVSIVGLRFIYGMKMAGTLALGMSGFSARSFLILNGVGATAWAIVISLAGYGIGEAARLVLADVEGYEIAIGILLVAAAALIFLYRRSRNRSRT
jgi:membrane protein DedA with SNARE-associated domain